MLHARGLGRAMVVRTLRLTAIGESQVADRLGEALLRATNPIVATYARVEAVDVRISAVDGGDRSAVQLADEAEATVLAAVGGHVWARGATTWADAISEALDARGWSLAITERGTGGSVTALLGELALLRRAEVTGHAIAEVPETSDDEDPMTSSARAVREAAGADVGMAVAARPRGGDTAVSVALALPDRTHRERRLAFLTGPQGRSRAALSAAAILLEQIRRQD
jgi:nicotinamide-nucleotide amidase